MSSENIDFNSSAFFANPYPTYRYLQQQGIPYYLATEDTWLIARYEDVARVLKDTTLSKKLSSPVSTPLDVSMLFQDPPNHTRLRGLVNQAFTPTRVRELEQRIVAIADARIDQVKAHGSMDFIAEFAMPLPVIVIAEMLGVPPEARDNLHHWSMEMMKATEGGPMSEDDGRKMMAALYSMKDCFMDLIVRRREQSGDDILSALIAAHDAQEKMTGDELIGTAILLLIAGHETTVNLLGNGLLTLFRHPEQFDRLKRNPALMAGAIEEMLRYESPVQQGTFRVTTAPLEVCGQTLGVGLRVGALIGAANRDPEHFPEPDRFDITRNPNRHLGFGLGIHFCMGAALARMEARIGFSRLFEKLPALHLAGETPGRKTSQLVSGLRGMGLSSKFEKLLMGRSAPEALSWRPSTMVRGLESLKVQW